MKQTFTSRYFDWVLIVVSALFFVDMTINLFLAFDFLSTYLLRISFCLVALAAFMSLILKNANGERYARFFIIISLIFPFIFTLNLFLVDWGFYGIRRLDLFEDPVLHFKFILGIVSFILSIKYSKQTPVDRKKDYGVLISLVGLFLILLILIRTVEPYFTEVLNKIPVWKTILKISIGLLIVYFGIRLKNDKVGLGKSVVLTLVLMFIYGLL